ncbi:MAG TPA: helix-turn-helix domain-containing protein [Epulopiscium sp.]|nr:helix-turn-helix domain-containing protein [Candidatus Epulonipiscium sp.]
MKELSNMEATLEICKALSSPVRLKLLNIISKGKQVNLNELAGQLNITNGAITQHIKILVDAGIIDVMSQPGIRGSQKICYLKEYKFLIDLSQKAIPEENTYQVEIPVGGYTKYEVYPTCGMATETSLIGEIDDPRYFDAPERSEVGIIWFGHGFVEYRIPNYLKSYNTLSELQLTFEISSEAPGICEVWPSDIYFSLNDTALGYWTSPGDYGEVKGIYTPPWWPEWNQYGLLKLLSINEKGTFIDGVKISNVNLAQLRIDNKSDIVFKIAVPKDAKHVGGVTLFGKGFGNYNQNINARIIFG